MEENSRRLQDKILLPSLMSLLKTVTFLSLRRNLQIRVIKELSMISRNTFFLNLCSNYVVNIFSSYTKSHEFRGSIHVFCSSRARLWKHIKHAIRKVRACNCLCYWPRVMRYECIVKIGMRTIVCLSLSEQKKPERVISKYQNQSLGTTKNKNI